MGNYSAMNNACPLLHPRRQTGRTEKCFSPGEQNTGSRPFSGLTAGVGIVWD